MSYSSRTRITVWWLDFFSLTKAQSITDRFWLRLINPKFFSAYHFIVQPGRKISVFHDEDKHSSMVSNIYYFEHQPPYLLRWLRVSTDLSLQERGVGLKIFCCSGFDHSRYLCGGFWFVTIFGFLAVARVSINRNLIVGLWLGFLTGFI